MSSDTDKGPEQASRPDDMSPEELDRALRWLEELGGKSGESAVQPLDESPFHGLFDLEEGDVPAWLRETPSTDSGELSGDTESRLDWLAKMAQRESIEELPTLEWRRLSDSEQASLIAASVVDEAKTEAFTREPEDAGAEAAAPVLESTPATEAGLAPPVEPESDVDESSVARPVVDDEDLAATAVAGGLILADAIEEHLTSPVEIIEESALVPATVGEIVPAAEAEVSRTGDDAVEAVIIVQATTQADASPQLDDMDAAMAWLEELAANQETPIEDLPSVADRALASKLMAEASQLSAAKVVQPAEKSESRASEVAALAGATLAGATFYEAASSPEDAEAADAAGTEAVGTFAPPAKAVLTDTEAIGTTNTVDVAKAVASTAVVEALIAGTDAATTEVEDAAIVSGAVVAVDEPFEKEASMQVNREYATEPMMEVATAMVAGAAANLPGVFDLGDALEQLDLLAVPAHGALDDIARVLAAEGASALATPYSLDATLDWLLPVAGPVLDSLPGTIAAATVDAPANDASATSALSLETSLVDDMPEDPDAALAWMSQFVEDEPLESGETVEAPADTGTRVELSESVLLEMPDDPDEAIAWLEKLASQGNTGA